MYTVQFKIYFSDFLVAVTNQSIFTKAFRFNKPSSELIQIESGQLNSTQKYFIQVNAQLHITQ